MVAELAMIALFRVVDMIERAPVDIGATTVVPDIVNRTSPSLKAIRDAFEHANERALGQVNHRAHPAATSIFERHRLLWEHVVAYGSHELDMGDIADLLGACRQFVKGLWRQGDTGNSDG